MPAGASAQVPVTFEDIAIYFSQKEWENLEESQKELYKDVMKENYQTLISLGSGSPTVTPDIICHIERGEEPYIRDEPGSEERETGRSSCSENEEPSNNKSEPHRWELGEKLVEERILSERDSEHTSSSSDWGRNCRDQYILERKKNSTGNSATNSTVCKQSASNATHTGQEQTNQTAAEACLCDVCGIFLGDPVTLKSHQHSHTEERPSACLLCGKIPSQKGEQEQQKIHTHVKPFTCSECGEIMQQQSVNKGEKLVTSTEHGNTFIKNVYLTNYHEINTGQQSFSCSETMHLTDHQACNTCVTPLSCTECAKSFNEKSSLTEHQKIHIAEKSFSCTVCGESFSQKSDLSDHQLIHIDKKPFSCPECGKRFIEKSNLNSHLTTHTNEKRFSCTECGNNFKFKNSLKNHQKIHSGERPFSCTECGKAFRLKAILTQHQKIHTDERPFLCPECGKSFRYLRSLKNHEELHMQYVTCLYFLST
ncbi:zinc finger protein OZF-like [Rhinatrema bivittatum]|uniref:zinc finger protein OZF-like n=1 Tax=Rhinatrema bivittatum TaxID=194408 RepID=UPI00112C763F|nr:zinc finger protein OZF-like [Rhinatrema bivittatum]